MSGQQGLIILGRDGMGTTSEDEFQSWAAFVCARIDGACCFDVDVEVRGPRDIQTDEIRHPADAYRQIMRDALDRVWEQWCSEGAPSPTVQS